MSRLRRRRAILAEIRYAARAVKLGAVDRRWGDGYAILLQERWWRFGRQCKYASRMSRGGARRWSQ
jgi:hypothetical protein